MRRVNVLTFVSLDGVMQGPGGPDEDTSGGFRRGGWTGGYFDEVVGQEMANEMGGKFDLLVGRRTYDIFASYCPPSEGPFAKPIHDRTKHAASNRPRAAARNT